MNVHPKFQIFTDKSGEFRFRLKARNGEIILRSSEGYTTKQNCLKGVASVKANAPFDNRYKRSVSGNGQYYFILKAANGEELGISEMYTTTYNRDKGIEAVKRDAPNAPIEDLTLSSTYSS